MSFSAKGSETPSVRCKNLTEGCFYALFDAMDELEFLRLVGEIVNVSADEAVLGENGKVDVKKLQPITYAPMNHNYKVPGEKV